MREKPTNATIIHSVYYYYYYQEKTCSSAHEPTPFSNSTINSVLRRWEVGRAKDFSAPHHALFPPLTELLTYFAITI
jgi:hypothetical protein